MVHRDPRHPHLEYVLLWLLAWIVLVGRCIGTPVGLLWHADSQTVMPMAALSGEDHPEGLAPPAAEADANDRKWTVVRLRDLLRLRGLWVSGRKADLVERLQTFDADQRHDTM